jgi:hypothetical protein
MMGSVVYESREDRDVAISALFENTELTLEEIAAETDTSYKIVWQTVARLYTPETRLRRKQRSYRNSKLGEKNPMQGRTGDQHHNYIGEVSDGKGYVMVLKPEWYTGRQGSKYVFKHTLIMCEALGLTELPRGWVVHHIDKDKLNNDLVNLALMTSSAHARLHQLERATTIPKGSREEGPSRSAERPSPRDPFVPRQEHTLVECDYSQVA